jgi:hypothetical protein
MGVANSATKDNLPLEEMMQKIAGIDITICPCCNKGKMQFYADIPKSRARAPNSGLCVAA